THVVARAAVGRVVLQPRLAAVAHHAVAVGEAGVALGEAALAVQALGLRVREAARHAALATIGGVDGRIDLAAIGHHHVAVGDVGAGGAQAAHRVVAGGAGVGEHRARRAAHPAVVHVGGGVHLAPVAEALVAVGEVGVAGGAAHRVRAGGRGVRRGGARL